MVIDTAHDGLKLLSLLTALQAQEDGQVIARLT